MYIKKCLFVGLKNAYHVSVGQKHLQVPTIIDIQQSLLVTNIGQSSLVINI